MRPRWRNFTRRSGLLDPIDKMTPAALEARVVYHEANAEVFEAKQEMGMAKQFRDLARKYREELERRIQETAR